MAIKELRSGATLTVDTTLAPEELEPRIARQFPSTGAVVVDRLTSRQYQFAGEARNGVLWIRRLHGHVNSFSPIFRGRITALEDGSRVSGKFDLLKPVIVVLHFMRGVALLFVALGAYVSLTPDVAPLGVVIALFGIACFVLTLLARRTRVRDDEDDICGMIAAAASDVARDDPREPSPTTSGP